MAKTYEWARNPEKYLDRVMLSGDKALTKDDLAEAVKVLKSAFPLPAHVVRRLTKLKPNTGKPREYHCCHMLNTVHIRTIFCLADYCSPLTYLTHPWPRGKFTFHHISSSLTHFC